MKSFFGLLACMTVFICPPAVSQQRYSDSKDVLDSMILSAKNRKDTSSVIAYTVARYDQYGFDTTDIFWRVHLNNFIYYFIFQWSDEENVLRKAAEWMEKLIEAEPKNAFFLDTYANLLYKCGKTEMAMRLQSRAVQFDPGNAESLENLEKMKAGKPTWRTSTQGKEIGISDSKQWPIILEAQISDDGRYAAYVVSGKYMNTNTVTFVSTDSRWRKDIPFASEPIFLPNNRSATFSLPGDSMGIIFLGTEKIERVPHAQVPRQKVHNLPDWISDSMLNDLRQYKIDRVQGQTVDGKSVYVALHKPQEDCTVTGDSVGVSVWSYLDTELYCRWNFKNKIVQPITRNAIIHDDGRIIYLGEDKEVCQRPLAKESKWALIQHYPLTDAGEARWNNGARAYAYLVNIESGDRLNEDGYCVFFERDAVLSPAGKFVLFFDTSSQDYFSFSTVDKRRTNITANIKTTWTNFYNDHPDVSLAKGYCGWLQDDEWVLIYDQWDLWAIDPTGKREPINVTNGFGKLNRTVFRISGCSKKLVYKEKDHLLLAAFNRETKDNGFYRKKLFAKGDPQRLTMGPYLYEMPERNGWLGAPQDAAPIKAKFSESYLVKRMNETEYPNYFFTKDFKTYSPVSDLRPEKPYNGMKAELLTWTNNNGEMRHGILYKPFDFDSTKKYPVIFHYYDKVSDALHNYLLPDYSRGDLNIPYFVSQGYLIFAPDIHYKVGETGVSAYENILSAADLLAGRPYIDTAAMGLQGHSFGGFATNFIVTKTNRFKAAASAAGPSNLVSMYGHIFEDGSSKQSIFESGQMRMGSNMWEAKEKYLANSPVLFADMIETPLLLMYNKEDGAVEFTQGLEFFTALRRLQKKAWMLQYEGEGHTLQSDAAARDYTFRLQQFFDHYLKGALPPKWMTRGVRAVDKGIIDGLELDDLIKTPGEGLLTEEERRKVEALQNRKPVSAMIE